MTDQTTPNLLRFERALADGDVILARGILEEMPEEDRAVLEELLGGEAVARMMQHARSLRAGGSRRGRVVVIHGIMGSLLDSVRDDERDRIWIHVLRLMRGRFKELRLRDDDTPVDDGLKIVTAGLHSTYAPMVVDLAREWHVKPFAYDWRQSIERSADLLAKEIKTWANGEPVHIVAHSMGGLVSRCMMARHPDVWGSMADPSGLEAGGRLIMLGTPNHGSFAVSLVLTGAETLVKGLAALDFSHDLREVLAIVGTFTGIYQMLPSPSIDLQDDHRKLFDRGAWGRFPVVQPLLDRAQEFHQTIARAIDPARMIYVAGYNQETVSRVRIEEAGRFKYRVTDDGDGRVTHALGFLKGVPNYFVEEEHGDLPKNEMVLDAIDDLLATGQTADLPESRPKRRKSDREVWLTPEEVEPMDPDVERELAVVQARRATSDDSITPVESARIEAAIVARWLPSEPARPASKKKPREVPSLKVEVVWGDITEVKGDVYAVGHYHGMLPQDAELALDRVVSGDANPERHVIRLQTRRGVLRGDVGDVNFFPWARDASRLVAIVGMGHVGTFGADELKRAAKALAWSVAPLPSVTTLCSVLIGSRVMSVSTAVEGSFTGIADALAEGGLSTKIDTVRIVERDKDRAEEILRAAMRARGLERIRSRLKLQVKRTLVEEKGGRIRPEHALAVLLASAAEATKAESSNGHVSKLLHLLPAEGGYREGAGDALRGLAQLGSGVDRMAEKLEVRIQAAEPEAAQLPTRVSIVSSNEMVRASAMTRTAAIPERIQKYDHSLFEEIAAQMTDPPPERVTELGQFVGQFLLPSEFRPLLRNDRPIVFEVDRTMARVCWEMLNLGQNETQAIDPIAVSVPFSRQLRTTYSPPPAQVGRSGQPIRALVIGDPGDPEKEESLKGARDEAKRVVEIMKGRGVEVTALIGAPDRKGRGRERGYSAASRLAVLQHLYRGGYDIVHYAGHGDFDPDSPERAGWLFKGGLLTANEIARLENPPMLIVANACLSANSSTRTRQGQDVSTLPSDMDLAPGLADEFLKRGVHNYVGTAWSVSDDGAVLFAETLYSMLLSPARPGWTNLGQSLLSAREVLYRKRGDYGSLWAAYQHYGDPLLELGVPPEPTKTKPRPGGDDATEDDQSAPSWRSPSTVPSSAN